MEWLTHTTLWLFKCDPVSTDDIIYRNNQEVAWLRPITKGRADRGESLTTIIIVTFLSFTACWLWKGHSSGGHIASLLGWTLVRHFLLFLFFFPYSIFKLMCGPLLWQNPVQVNLLKRCDYTLPRQFAKSYSPSLVEVVGNKATDHPSKRVHRYMEYYCFS